MPRARLKTDGTVLLGDHLSCDGFSYSAPTRVQTHIHFDHMSGFGTSKANQHIVASEQTCDMLIALYNADLPYRSNLSAVACNEDVPVNGDLIRLVPSNHMLGSVQVSVTCIDGYKIGYSSDFFWPVDEVIKVDELLVDSTYGDPDGIRAFSQDITDEQLLFLAHERIRGGRSLTVLGHNGRLQHAMHLLSEVNSNQTIASERAFALASVYESNGFTMPRMIRCNSDEGLAHLRSREPFVAYVTLPERRHLPWIDRSTKITLSAYMSRNSDPVVHYGNGDACVSFTDHADFNGTLEYVEASGAKVVLTDPRSGNAQALALALRARLGIDARMATREDSLSWG